MKGTPTSTMMDLLLRLAGMFAEAPDPTTLPAAEGRAQMESHNHLWNSDLPAMAETRDILLGGHVPGRLLMPQGDGGGEAILYIHGGGWSFGSAAGYETLGRRLAIAAQAPVVTFDYRLAPEHPFPAGLDDCAETYAAMPDLLPRRRVSLAGDSAGANLAMALMFRLQQERAPLPASALLFYGAYDLDFTTRSFQTYEDGPILTRGMVERFWTWYLGSAAPQSDPMIAPLTAPDDMLAALPPLYLSAAELDPLRCDSEALAARLQALGRRDVFEIREGVVHGFMIMGNQLPEAREAIADAGRAFAVLVDEGRGSGGEGGG